MTTQKIPSKVKKLLDQLSDQLRIKHYSLRTENTYISWVRKFILFHDKRHPRDMGTQEINAFISHLVLEKNVAASTHTAPVIGAGETRLSAPFNFSTAMY